MTARTIPRNALVAAIAPLRALRYDLARTGGLGARRGAALRRHRRGAARRAGRPLAAQRGGDRPPAGAGRRRPLPARRRDAVGLDRRRRRGAATRSPRCGRSSRTTPGPTGAAAPATGCSPACGWRTTAPGASGRTSARTRGRRRTGCGSRGPRGRTCRRSSPSTTATPGRRSRRTSAAPPFGEATDDDGTEHRLWRIADPEAIAAATEALAPAELLIADGHHRYETARVHAEETGAADPHVLMCLVSLRDPGLTIFPTHRLLTSVGADGRQALREAIRRDWEIEEVALEELEPDAGRRARDRLPRRRPPAPAPARAARPGGDRPARAPRPLARLPAAGHRGARGPAAGGRAGPERGRHRAPPRARLRALDGRGARARPRPATCRPPSSWARRRSSSCARSPRPARSCRPSRRTSSRRSPPACSSIHWTEFSYDAADARQSPQAREVPP